MCSIIYSHGWTGWEKAHPLEPEGRTGAPASQPQYCSASQGSQSSLLASGGILCASLCVWFAENIFGTSACESA